MNVLCLRSPKDVEDLETCVLRIYYLYTFMRVLVCVVVV